MGKGGPWPPSGQATEVEEKGADVADAYKLPQKGPPQCLATGHGDDCNMLVGARGRWEAKHTSSNKFAPGGGHDFPGFL